MTWLESKIGKACTVRDGAHAKMPRQSTGIKYLTSKNIKAGRLNLSNVDYISEEDFKKHCQRDGDDAKKPLEKDVLLCIIGASIGDSCFVPTTPDAGLSSSVAMLRANQSILDSEYLYYWTRSIFFQSAIQRIRSGAAQGFLSLEMVRSLPLSYPPLANQQRIADILSNYDRLIDNNTRRIALLEESIHRLYKEWFVYLRFPGWEKVAIVEGVPEGWELKKVKDFGTVTTGKTPSTKIPEHFGGSVPFIKTPDMHGNIFVISTEDSLTEMGANSQQKQYISAKAIMVACIGAKSGVVSLSSRTAQTNQQINSLIPNLEIFCYYCYYVLRELRTHLRAIGSNGATMINVNKNKFENMPVVLPLESLLKQFHQQASSVFEQILTLQIQNQKLREARDLLLSRLMNGSIAV